MRSISRAAMADHFRSDAMVACYGQMFAAERDAARRRAQASGSRRDVDIYASVTLRQMWGRVLGSCRDIGRVADIIMRLDADEEVFEALLDEAASGVRAESAA